MKIIISGTVDLDPAQMDAAMAAAKPLIVGALTQDGILDYDWCPDPLTPGRIRVFERWATTEALENHFKNHWYSDMRETLGQFGIRGAEVLKYQIDLAEPVYDETGTARADFFTHKAD
ncbi:MAG: antibiotic biosynthesis monooxygenase [Gammaproteobacteria bacterium]|nr:antibiotic biosynthesis monooxygenase [Gammaproteobacteria bacterium]